MSLRAVLGFALLLAALSVSSCSSGKQTTPSSSSSPSHSLRLVVAAAAKPSTVDPLTTPTNDGLELARQVYEPLSDRVRRVRSGKSVEGLVVSWHKAGGGKIWTMKLRSNVHFQNGALFDALAVARNARRWRTTVQGQSALPGLSKAKVESKSRVSFYMQSAVNLPGLLHNPRLGVVSPRDMRPTSGAQAVMVRRSGGGTGPYRLNTQGTPGSTVLAENKQWWARHAGMIVSFPRIVFRWIVDEQKRVETLSSGSASLAMSVTAVGIEALRGNPNIELYGTPPGTVYAAVSWLHGFEPSPLGAESLQSAWLAVAQQ